MTERVRQDDATFCEIHRLTTMCLEGDAPTSACDLLRDLILDDPELLDLYVHYLSDSISLRCVVSSPIDSKAMAVDLSGDAPFDIPTSLPAVLPPQDISPTFGSSSTAYPNTFGYFSSGWPIAYLVATIVFAIGLAIGTIMHVSQPGQFVGPSNSVWTRNPPSPISNSSPIVGRITGMVDCRWTGIYSDSRGVVLGRRYELVSGLMEITYDTGAKVILQGPVTYEVESRNGGFLPIGKLTGKVENETAKGFTVRTPTAAVTDLGTEFGVEVDRQGSTKMHVFRGSIRIEVPAQSGVKSTSGVLLADQSACVENGAKHIAFLDSFTERPQFARNLSTRVMKVLDLVDMVAGGDGHGKARNCGIDPLTGKIAAKQPQTFDMQSDGRYHAVNDLPFIDGVFIPCPANGPVQLDSAGHTFADFPKDRGKMTWGHLWAGGQWPRNHAGNLFVNAKLVRGLDYSATWHSMLGMHANKGITFDLAAVRQANPGCQVVQFSAAAGRCGHGSATEQADVWIFVDGQVRFRREQLTDDAGELKITVLLDDRSRFLTLVVTDGGDNYFGDTFLFGDPKLTLLEESNATGQ